MHWFHPDWWRYLLQPRYYDDEPWWAWFSVIKCRIQGHPHEESYDYCPIGMEPNMRCNNCGDALG